MKLTTKIFLAAYLLMTLVIFTLPFFSDPNYSIVQNTTSQLGAQNTPNAWIMNATFVMMGLGSNLAGWKRFKGYLFHQIVLVIFGLALCMTAIFSHAPIDPEIPFNAQEDQLHSVFATLTGFAFTLLAISSAFIIKKTPQRILALGIGVVATLLSLLMVWLPDWMGIWQRVLFLFSFGWLMYENWRKTF